MNQTVDMHVTHEAVLCYHRPFNLALLFETTVSSLILVQSFRTKRLHIISIIVLNMAQDPFESVRRLGLNQQIQAMAPIGAAAIPVQQIAALEVPCRMQVRNLIGELVTLANIPNAVRGELALQLIRFIHPSDGATRIRPISLILNMNGTVQAEPVHMDIAHNQPGVYPARYRLPPSTINGLPLQEQVWRAEKFALGVLLYELLVGRRIFEIQNDYRAAIMPGRVVQSYYRATMFPGLEDLPAIYHGLIYACWSAEFGRYIALGRFRRYVHDNPYRFTLQAATGVLSTAALVTVPVLGIIGFSAIGPVAGSVAAGWQASIGAVEAGSLFAFCQSAAMGGAAAAGLTTAGISGLATGVVDVAVAWLGGLGLTDLENIFVRNFRR